MLFLLDVEFLCFNFINIYMIGYASSVLVICLFSRERMVTQISLKPSGWNSWKMRGLKLTPILSFPKIWVSNLNKICYRITCFLAMKISWNFWLNEVWEVSKAYITFDNILHSRSCYKSKSYDVRINYVKGERM